MRRTYGVVVLVISWYAISLLTGTALVPFPHTVAKVFAAQIANGSLLLHSLYSAGRFLTGMALAVLIAVPVGLLAGVSQKADQYVTPVLYLVYPLPKIAFLPVFIALFGLGELSKVILLLTVLVFQLILAVRDGVRAVPIELERAAITLQMDRKSRLLRLYFPSALPSLFHALRIGVGIGMAVLFFGENYATTYGLGYTIMNQWSMIQYPGMFASIIALGLVAGGMIVMIDRAERHLCPWRWLDQ